MKKLLIVLMLVGTGMSYAKDRDGCSRSHRVTCRDYSFFNSSCSTYGWYVPQIRSYNYYVPDYNYVPRYTYVRQYDEVPPCTVRREVVQSERKGFPGLIGGLFDLLFGF